MNGVEDVDAMQVEALGDAVAKVRLSGQEDVPEYLALVRQVEHLTRSNETLASQNVVLVNSVKELWHFLRGHGCAAFSEKTGNE